MAVLLICALLTGSCERGGHSHRIPEHSRGGHAVSLTTVETAQHLAAKRGWVGRLWLCLYDLGNRESGWSVEKWNGGVVGARARHGGSGAYGVGQALPAEKMRRYGRDYMTSATTQVRWMIAYVSGRYGDPCSAVAFHNGHGYY